MSDAPAACGPTFPPGIAGLASIQSLSLVNCIVTVRADRPGWDRLHRVVELELCGKEKVNYITDQAAVEPHIPVLIGMCSVFIQLLLPRSLSRFRTNIVRWR